MSNEEKYAHYVAYKAALDRCEAEAPKSHRQRIEELIYERGYYEGRIDALKAQIAGLVGNPQ
jgi:hypothetical protein